MLLIKQFISRYAARTAAVVAAAVALTSCGSVFDDLEPCPSGVTMRFVYDYNLESAQAFHKQVDCLTLHLYNADGKYVTTVTETSGKLADEGWRMTLDLAPGTYHAIAYGGLACDKASFAHAAVPAEGADYRSIAMCLKDDHIGRRLHDHFHGALDFTVSASATDYRQVTMSMTKTTNHFRILLHNLSRQPVDGKDFEFIITDDNTRLDHNNRPVRGHKVSYPAWDSGKVLLSESGNVPVGKAAAAAAEDTDPSLAFGELSTSRLTRNSGARLIINKKDDGREVLNIPLNQILLASMSSADPWGEQEYLDRGSRWNLTFFLDEGDNWLRTEVIVNGWAVRIRDIDF